MTKKNVLYCDYTHKWYIYVLLVHMMSSMCGERISTIAEIGILLVRMFLISIYVGIIASLEPLYEAVLRVYYPFPNCCSLSLDCSWYSKGAISSNTNWWVYSTLPYISHGSKENIFGGIFLVLVEEINIFKGECLSCVCSLCAETISALLYRTQLSAGAMHSWHFMELSSRFKNKTF